MRHFLCYDIGNMIRGSHHVCAYNTQCVLITSDMTELDVTATHNQLPGNLPLVDLDHEELERPSSCAASNAGAPSSDMRCAGDIHRAVTSMRRVPEEIHDWTLDVVELVVQHHNIHDFVTFDTDNVARRAAPLEGPWVDGYAIGYVVPDAVKNAQGGRVGTGVFAHCPWGHESDPANRNYGNCKVPWENQGLIQCEVKYTKDAPLHMNVTGVPPLSEEDGDHTRSTLVTRVCLRRSDINGEHAWEESTFVDAGQTCGEWGITSGLRTLQWNYFYFSAKCSLLRPSVTGVVPPTAFQFQNSNLVEVCQRPCSSHF